MADPHLKSQIKFTWNEFCIYIHSQDNNQPSPKDSSRLWFFLTHNFSLPVCYPVYNYFYSVKSLKQSTHAFFNLFFNVHCKGFSQVVLVVKNLPANTGDIEKRVNLWVQKITWSRAWQPTSISLPGESHGQRSLVGYSPEDLTESQRQTQLKWHMQIYRVPHTLLNAPANTALLRHSVP